MALDYPTFVSQLSNLLIVSSADANLATQLPGIIDYGEQRLYRDLDLVYTSVTTDSEQVSSGVRTLTITSSYRVIDTISLLTSAGATSSNGTRVPLTPTSREFLDALYPGGSDTGEPQFFAIQGVATGSIDNIEIVLGPTPDAGYFLEINGEQRPATLSSANSSTILTQYVPELFMAACMVYATGYLKNFGAQGDNPQQAQAWENQYQLLLQSAQVEQARVTFTSQGWTAKPPAPLATPPRA